MAILTMRRASTLDAVKVALIALACLAMIGATVAFTVWALTSSGTGTGPTCIPVGRWFDYGWQAHNVAPGAFLPECPSY